VPRRNTPQVLNVREHGLREGKTLV